MTTGWFVHPYLETKSRAITDAVVRASQGLDLATRTGRHAVGARCAGRDGPAGRARTLEQLLPCLDIDDITLPEPIIAALDDVTGGTNHLR